MLKTIKHQTASIASAKIYIPQGSPFNLNGLPWLVLLCTGSHAAVFRYNAFQEYKSYLSDSLTANFQPYGFGIVLAAVLVGGI